MAFGFNFGKGNDKISQTNQFNNQSRPEFNRSKEIIQNSPNNYPKYLPKINDNNSKNNSNELNKSGRLEDQKNKIIEFINQRGPSLPIHLSSHLKLDTLLIGAFLSDLLSDKTLKMSNMRVGNSPVYYLPGQEELLDKYSNFLGGKEKEAFYLLKEQQVLDDLLMLPPIRVALRSIKDFAFSIELNGKLYWRFIKTSEEEAYRKIDNSEVNFSQLPKGYIRNLPKIIENKDIQNNNIQLKEIQEKRIEENIEQKKVEIIKEAPKIENIIEKNIEKNISENKLNNINQNLSFNERLEIEREKIKQELLIQLRNEGLLKEKEAREENKIKTIKKVQVKKISFVSKVEEFLEKEGVNIVGEVKKGLKEFSSIVSVDDGTGGKKEYLCIAKEKKSVTDKELMKNLAIGQKRNLPVLFITSGEASKKAIEWMDYLGNVIIYKKMDLQ